MVEYRKVEKVPFSELKGKVIKRITFSEYDIGFKMADGSEYRMEHEQDCCEDVRVEDIDGFIQDLIGSPILMAEEVKSDDFAEPSDDVSQGADLWTFYKLATIKGSVTIRWYGTSNGCYSMEVDLNRLGERYLPEWVKHCIEREDCSMTKTRFILHRNRVDYGSGWETYVGKLQSNVTARRKFAETPDEILEAAWLLKTETDESGE